MKELDSLRKKIHSMDMEILSLLAERSRYPVNKGFYTETNWPENSAALEYANRFYLKVLEKVCGANRSEDLEYSRELKHLDERIILKLMERTGMGMEVARVKCPRGLSILQKDVEKRKLREIGRVSERYSLDPQRTMEAFQMIMDETKRIQKYAIDMPSSNDAVSLETYRAGNDIARDVMESCAREQIRRYAERGIRCSLKTTEVKETCNGEDFVREYLVEIFEI